jgi:hypothetical protein
MGLGLISDYHGTLALWVMKRKGGGVTSGGGRRGKCSRLDFRFHLVKSSTLKRSYIRTFLILIIIIMSSFSFIIIRLSPILSLLSIYLKDCTHHPSNNKNEMAPLGLEYLIFSYSQLPNGSNPLLLSPHSLIIPPHSSQLENHRAFVKWQLLIYIVICFS